MSAEVLERLRAHHGSAVLSTHSDHGDETAVVDPARVEEIARFLRDDPVTSMEMLMDLTGVDYLGVKEPRFEVVYHFYSLSKNHRVRIKAALDEEAPSLPSVSSLWSSALWMEREAYDLYGIVFEGHPDLRRILMYPEFEGYPLRKDYDMEDRQPRIPARPGRTHL